MNILSSAVAVLIFNENDEILLQLRDEHAPSNPNQWGFFGGGLEEETVLDAAKREIREELEYNLKKPTHIMTRKMVLSYRNIQSSNGRR